MNIQEGIKKYAITHYSNAYNFDNFSTEISSIHFFNADNLEVFYVVPSIYALTCKITIVNRVNPIDSENKQEIKGSHYAPYYLVSLPFDGSCIARMVTATHKNNLFSDCSMRSLSDVVKNGDFIDFCVVDDNEFDNLLMDRWETLKTGATVITAQRYDDMLNVLPPCRWHSVGGWSVFHISERLSGDIVSWYAQKGDQNFTFDQDAKIKNSDILEVLNNALLIDSFKFSNNGELIIKPDQYSIGQLNFVYNHLIGQKSYIRASRINHLREVFNND